MVRRLVLLVLVAATVAACGGDGDDPPPGRTIAFLRAVANTDTAQDELLAELADAGWVAGDNLTVLGADPEEAHPTADEARAAVEGWVEDGVDLILALSSSGAAVADEAAPDVPVLFLSTDPMATGLVDDERSPEGHLTGGTFRVPADRTLDVALRAVGAIERLGLLWPSEDPAAGPVVDDVERAGARLGVEVVDRSFTAADDAAGAVEALVADGVQAVLLANAPSTVRAFDAIEPALAAAGVPVVANTTNDFALVTLQPDTDELYRQLGRQAVRLLGGTAVADVPVEDPAGYRITLDRAVAERLGIELPAELVELADEVRGE